MSKYILQVCHSYTPPFVDIARQYVQLFKQTNFHVVTVYLTGNHNNTIAEATAGEVIFLENTSKDLARLKLKPIKQLKRLCREFSFEFAIAHRYKPIYICCQIPKLKVIGVHHHAHGDYSRFMRRLFANRQRGRLFLLGVSNSVCADLKQALPKFNQQHIATLHNSMDLNGMASTQLDRTAARHQLGLPASDYLFGHVGRLHPDKDQPTLLHAFAQVAKKTDHAKLVLIGQGKSEQLLKQLAVELEISDRLIFLGHISNASLYFKAFNSFVLSSAKEAFGLVLLEAIAAGLPIAATRVGGIVEVLGDTASLSTPGDTSALAVNMLRLYQMSEKEIQTVSERNRQRAIQRFSSQAITEKFWQLPFIDQLSVKPSNQPENAQ